MANRVWFILLIGLCFSSACAAATPISIPLPTPPSLSLPTVTLQPPTGALPTPMSRRIAPADVPACADAKNLDQPVEFFWAGMEDVIQNTPESNWTYYHCAQSQVALSAFYRQWMPKQPYNWIETYWEVRADATMGVYFHSSGVSTILNRWLYLWFLPEKSGEQTSYLVVAWWNVRPYC